MDLDALFELVRLKSGRCSIRCRTHNETMHIGTDPCTEAAELHVRPQRIAERAREAAGSGTPFVVWDVGLGPAGNAIATLETLRTVEAPVEIHSFEIDTRVLEFALRHAQALGYLAGWEEPVRALLARGEARPLPHVLWRLHRGDYLGQIPSAPPPAAIFHDPYSPARNPAMWNTDVFRAARERVGEGRCLLTNYTRSTAVRVTLALSGWWVGYGAATGEKEQTTVAASVPELLKRPLDGAWLRRVRASTNAAPQRGGAYARGPIGEADFAALCALPQFAQTCRLMGEVPSSTE
ncbi:MAG: MnmC family methyltransferase [Chthoniobacteraceae bacterium]|nr:MnmC family methyltransferase [Chthoniobacteraceae bacterium]